MTHLSVDPGTKDMGWALWEDNELQICGLARGKDWVETVLSLPKFTISQLTIEDQQIYRRSPINAHALLACARVVGAVVAYYDFPEFRIVTPAQWKGQLPKTVCNRRTLAKLTENELHQVGIAPCPESLKHNLLDAVGIGLWATGRRKTTKRRK
jgi:hypothetical protein|tara:strand:- start:1512 stop:1973 length:462 start_codon:yes stop_codon:yes gene_type:complete